VSHEPDDLARAIMAHNGMAAAFDTLLERVLAELRAALAVPPDAVDDVVEEEFRVVRQRLRRFRPRHEERCAQLLREHIAPADLPAVAAALQDEAVQAYFRAMRAVQEELRRETHALAAAMKEVALFERPGEADVRTTAPAAR